MTVQLLSGTQTLCERATTGRRRTTGGHAGMLEIAAAVEILEEAAEGSDEAEILMRVIDALDDAVTQLPSSSDWKWACLAIRRYMADDVAAPPLVRGVPRAPAV